MLNAAFYLLSATVLLGVILVLLHVRATEPAQLPKWQIGALHGLGGAVGVGLLLATLRNPVPSGHGTGPFRLDAVVLLIVGLAAGAGIPLMWRWRGKPSTLLIGLHATIAVAGYVMLLAFRSLG